MAWRPLLSKHVHARFTSATFSSSYAAHLTRSAMLRRQAVTAGCSICDVTTCGRPCCMLPLRAITAPHSAQLSLSVPQEVKQTSSGAQLISAATYRYQEQQQGQQQQMAVTVAG
jgi:hypothetical protein